MSRALEIIDAVQDGLEIKFLRDYQEASHSFINRPEYHEEMDYFLNSALGLTGESGEFADIIKKARFHGIPLTDEMRLKLKKELGDVLWYISQACIPLGTTLEEVATLNIRKLADRHKGSKFNAKAAAAKDEAKEGFVSPQDPPEIDQRSIPNQFKCSPAALCWKPCSNSNEYEIVKCTLLKDHVGPCSSSF